MSWPRLIRSGMWITALILLVWVFMQVPVSDISTAFSSISSGQWLAWILLNLVIILLLSGRWLVLLRAISQPLGFVRLLLIRQAGQTISFITPGPQFGGEPFQIYWLWKRFTLPGHTSVLAVAMDRFYELWLNLAVLLIGILFLLVTQAAEFVQWHYTALILMSIILAISALVWLILLRPGHVSASMRRLASRWQHHPRLCNLDTHWDLFSNTLRDAVENHKPGLLFALVLSLLGWVGIITETWLLLRFFDITPEFPELVFLLVCMRLAFLLPLPGGIGSFEAATYWAGQAMGLPIMVTAGLIVLMRLRDAVIISGGLAAFVYLNNLGFSDKHQACAG